MNKHPMKTFLLIFMLICLSSITSANECLNYGPAKVQLNGKISKRAYPGPPGYLSMAQGDRKEVMWFLRLERPICVNTNQNDPTGFEVEEKNVSEMQLALTPEQYEQYKNLLGRNVTASGELFHEHTGHHHTPVLLTVKDMEPLKK